MIGIIARLVSMDLFAKEKWTVEFQVSFCFDNLMAIWQSIFAKVSLRWVTFSSDIPQLCEIIALCIYWGDVNRRQKQQWVWIKFIFIFKIRYCDSGRYRRRESSRNKKLKYLRIQLYPTNKRSNSYTKHTYIDHLERSINRVTC